MATPAGAGMTQPGFTRGNRYLFSPEIWTWNLPSGYTCPGARACFAVTDRETGRMTRGKHAEFKCYSAVTERYPAVRAKSWANYDAIRDLDKWGIVDVLFALMPREPSLIRIHAAGDYWSQDYFDAWLVVCAAMPETRFWAFTKSLPYWINRIGHIPPNLMMTASYGGKHDHLIAQHGLKYARVVYSEEEARMLGLPIDTDDRLAAYSNDPFALLENFSRRKLQRQLPMASPGYDNP